MCPQNAPTKTHILPIFFFASLFGLSIFVLWKITSGVLAVRLAWPWLISLVVSAVGLLVLARDAK